MHKILIPDYLTQNYSNDSRRASWLEALPDNIHDICHRWGLKLGNTIEEGASCSWVSHCIRKDNSPAILKFGMPHMEAEHEIDGLAYWNGEPTVQLLESDHGNNAMLLESCVPGATLKCLEEHEQDVILSNILKCMWQSPPSSAPFRSLSSMIQYWTDEASAKIDQSPNQNFTEEGIKLLKELVTNSKEQLLLATDLHANNVLSARRKPWLAIDPKPFLGDPAYDATQHLLNCRKRLEVDPISTIQRYSSLLDLEWKRVRLWTFARLATGASSEDHSLAQIIGT